MNISDHSPRFRGKAYTRWKQHRLRKMLAFYLQHGSTITYYPDKKYWTITHMIGIDADAIELECLIHIGW